MVDADLIATMEAAAAGAATVSAKPGDLARLLAIAGYEGTEAYRLMRADLRETVEVTGRDLMGLVREAWAAGHSRAFPPQRPA